MPWPAVSNDRSGRRGGGVTRARQPLWNSMVSSLQTGVSDAERERMIYQMAVAYICDLEEEKVRLQGELDQSQDRVRYWQKLFVSTVGTLVSVLLGLLGLRSQGVV